MQKYLISILFIFSFLAGGASSAWAVKDFNVKSDTESFLFVSGTSGNVGIGTVLPVSELDIQAGATASPKIINVSGSFPDLDTTKTGLYIDVTAPVAGTKGVTGSWSEVRTTAGVGTTYTNAVTGLYGEVYHSGRATITNAMGLTTLVNQISDGPITNAYGIFPQVWKGAGSIASAWGMYYQGVPNINGDTLDGSGTVTSQYGVGIKKLTEATARNVALLIDNATEGTTTAGNFSILEESGYPSSFSGNLGLGTTEPDARLALHSTGATLVDSHVNEDLTGAGAIESRYAVGQSGEARTTPSDVQNFKFFFGGFDQEVARISVNAPTITGGNAIGTIDMYTQNAAGALVKQMTLDEHKAMFANNLGLGTSAPAARLHIATDNSQPNAMNITGADAYIDGNLEVDGKIYGDGSQLTNVPAGGAAGSTTQVQYNNAGNLAGASGLVYDANGNVGIGTTLPELLLDVNGNIKAGLSTGTTIEGNADWEGGDFTLKPFDNLSDAHYGWKYYGSGARKGDVVTIGYGYAPNPGRVFAFRDGAANVDRVVINVLTGNVGMGTTVPAAALHVGGGGTEPGDMPITGADLYVKGNIEFDGAIYGDATYLSNLPSLTEADTLDTVTGRGSNTFNAVGIGTTTVTGNLTTTGNVGIGTVDPSVPLSVNFNSPAGNQKILHLTKNQTTSLLYVDAEGDAVYTGSMIVDGGTVYNQTASAFVLAGRQNLLLTMDWANGASGNKILFTKDSFTFTPTEANTLMVIQDDGNVGIGTIVPASLLEVGARKFNITAAGNVGVGAVAPTASLHVANGSNHQLWLQNTTGSTNATVGILFNNSASTAYAKAGIFFERLDGTAQGSLHFATAGNAVGAEVVTKSSARMTIDMNGNVGVGTTLPVAALHVGGGGTVPGSMPITGADLYVKGNIEFDGAIYGDATYLSNLPSLSEVDTLDTVTGRGASTVNAVSIGTTTVTGGLTTAGNVGIGSAVPGAALDVNGVIKVRGTHAIQASMAGLTIDSYNSTFRENYVLLYGANGGKISSTSSGNISIGDGSTDVNLFVQSDGNVGIGTTAPAAALHVGAGGTVPGSMPITGADLYVKGNIEFDGAIYGDATYLSNLPSLTEADTLDTVTARGATTFNAVSIGTTTVTGGLTTTVSVGIGTVSPVYQFEVVREGMTAAAGVTSYSDTVTNNGEIVLRRARGTQASPEAVQSNDRLGAVIFSGAYSSANFANTAAIIARAEENFDGSLRGTYLEFETVAAGGTSRTEKMRLNSYGNLGIGTTTPLAHLQIGAGTNMVAGSPVLGANDALITGDLVVDGKIYGDGSLLSGITGGMSWTEVTGTSATMSGGGGYIANNAGLVTLTLPATASVGTTVAVVGRGAGGWKIAQNSGDIIHFGNQDTTTSTTGYLSSTGRYDSIELICVVANDEWVVRSSVGNITVF